MGWEHPATRSGDPPVSPASRTSPPRAKGQSRSRIAKIGADGKNEVCRHQVLSELHNAPVARRHLQLAGRPDNLAPIKTIAPPCIPAVAPPPPVERHHGALYCPPSSTRWTPPLLPGPATAVARGCDMGRVSSVGREGASGCSGEERHGRAGCVFV
jgi:hypothetical protein